MNNREFHRVYGEGRNGCNEFYGHWAARMFQYSDGVQELAELGCYWLLDIIATECLKPLRKAGPYEQGQIKVVSKGGKADITMDIADDAPPIWKRHIDMTDMPEGEWIFYLKDEGERFAMILPSEY